MVKGNNVELSTMDVYRNDEYLESFDRALRVRSTRC
jgi:hypothetical protein